MKRNTIVHAVALSAMLACLAPSALAQEAPDRIIDLDGALARPVGQLADTAYSIWNAELIQLEDSAVTVRTIVIALTVFLVGLMLSRLAERWLRRVARRRMHLEENVAANAARALYYLLLVLVGYYTLTVVNIPLTVFTFFGGALAIGVGFGAQNLINNFISGLILMIERPIRINDIIEVDGERGRVVHLGARCSRLHTFAGVDILIPNSSFLEKNVINWTLSDVLVRWSVSIGVAYGSPTREVERLIYEAIDQDFLIMKDPKPVVIFSEFGDNALHFEAFFWIAIAEGSDGRVIRSELRHRIDEMFREAGIVIAFPQRDIHLDTLKPLNVRLLKEDSPAS